MYYNTPPFNFKKTNPLRRRASVVEMPPTTCRCAFLISLSTIHMRLCHSPFIMLFQHQHILPTRALTLSAWVHAVRHHWLSRRLHKSNNFKLKNVHPFLDSIFLREPSYEKSIFRSDNFLIVWLNNCLIV